MLDPPELAPYSLGVPIPLLTDALLLARMQFAFTISSPRVRREAACFAQLPHARCCDETMVSPTPSFYGNGDASLLSCVHLPSRHAEGSLMNAREPKTRGEAPLVPNLRWWLIFVCSLGGLVLAAASGHILAMWRIDAYKVSFVTLSVYFLVTVFLGRLTWRITRGDRAWHLLFREVYDYAVTLMTMLGLIGTVIGFMGLLATSFSSLGSADVAAARMAIGSLTAGSANALVNTLVGLMGAVGLKLQVINLNLAAAHEHQQ